MIIEINPNLKGCKDGMFPGFPGINETVYALQCERFTSDVCNHYRLVTIPNRLLKTLSEAKRAPRERYSY